MLLLHHWNSHSIVAAMEFVVMMVVWHGNMLLLLLLVMMHVRLHMMMMVMMMMRVHGVGFLVTIIVFIPIDNTILQFSFALAFLGGVSEFLNVRRYPGESQLLQFGNPIFRELVLLSP